VPRIKCSICVYEELIKYCINKGWCSFLPVTEILTVFGIEVTVDDKLPGRMWLWESRSVEDSFSEECLEQLLGSLERGK